MAKHEVGIQYCNGQQEWVHFDHAPTLGTTVKVPNSEKYGEVISVGPDLKQQAKALNERLFGKQPFVPNPFK